MTTIENGILQGEQHSP